MHESSDSALTYHEATTLDLGQQWEGAADTDRLGFATADGEVTILDENGRETLDVDRQIDGIELDGYVICLSGSSVASYTQAGVELWTRTVDRAVTVVSFGGRDVLGVLTDDARLVGLDIETGSTLFETDRPHDEFSEVTAVGGSGVVCLATWSFVACIDDTGEILLDRNLDGTVEDIGLLGEVILAALRDGRLLALDRTADEIRWTNSVSVRQLASAGEEWLPLLTDSELAAINREGRMTPLSIPASQRVVSSRDASVIAVTGPTAAQVYRQGESPAEALSAGVLTDEIGVESPLRAAVENTSTRPVDAAVQLEVTPPLALDSEYETVELPPGTESEIVYRPQEPPSAEEMECSLLVDNHEVGSETVRAEREARPEEALAVDAALSAVEGEEAVFTVSVTNDGDIVFDQIKIGESHSEYDVGPGSEVTARVRRPLGSADEVTVAGTIGAETTAHDAVLQAPADPLTAVVSREDSTESLDVTLQPQVEAPVEGTVTIDSDTGPSLERTVALETGESLRIIVLELPTAGHGSARVTVSSPLLDAEQDARVEGRACERSEMLCVERELPDSAPRGEQFTEAIQVSNRERQPVTDLVVADGLGTYRFERLASEQTVRLERRHAVFDGAATELPPIECRGEVPGGGEVSAESEAGEVSLLDTDLEARGRIVRTGSEEYALRLSLANNTGGRCAVLSFGLDIGSGENRPTWAPGGSTSVDDERTIERQFQPPRPVPNDRPVPLLVKYQTGGEEKIVRTLAATTDEGRSEQDVAFEGTVTQRTKLVTGEQGVVELTVTNESRTPVSDLTVRVEGESVLDTPISSNRAETAELPPGGEVSVLADVKPEQTEQTRFTVRIQGTVAGSPATEQLVCAGPVATSTELWQENDYLAEWEVTDTDGEPSVVEFETGHLVTDFRPTEGGNPR